MFADLENRIRCSGRALIGVIGLTLVLIAGCFGSKLKTHPVNGKVEMTDGEVAPLAGSIIEFMQQADPLVRASGKISSDGAFKMETLHQGEIIAGVPEGVYAARIILSDEDENGNPKKGGMPIHRRFLDFNTSKWTVTVPSESVTLKVSKS